jgi:hypothetical protein
MTSKRRQSQLLRSKWEEANKDIHRISSIDLSLNTINRTRTSKEEDLVNKILIITDTTRVDSRIGRVKEDSETHQLRSEENGLSLMK